MRPNIFPVLRYRNGHAAIDWLGGAFGFELKGVVENADGGVAHAELALGAAIVAMSSAGPATDDAWSRVRQGIYVHVGDVDAHHDRARAAGADIVQPPTDTGYGSREYAARDIDGHVWGFGTYDMQAPDAPPAAFPEIHYRGGAAAIEFLTSAFGFERTMAVPGPDDSILHAELRFGDGVVMIGSAPDGLHIWGELRQCTNVYVADPDAHFAAAEAAGAAIVLRPHDTAWGSRGYVARDIEGFIWGFSTYRPNVSKT